MRRNIAIIGILLMLFASISVYAEGDPSVATTVPDQAKPGDIFSLGLEIRNNPGVATWLFQLEWDAEQFELVNNSIALGEAFSSGTIVSNTGVTGKAVLNWFSLQDVTADGLLFSMRLKVKETAKSGRYAIVVKQSSENTVNLAEQEITLRTENASIAIVIEDEPGVDLPLETNPADPVESNPETQPASGSPAETSESTPMGEIGTESIEQEEVTDEASADALDSETSETQPEEFESNNQSIGTDDGIDGETSSGTSDRQTGTDVNSSQNNWFENGKWIMIGEIILLAVAVPLVIILIRRKRK